MKRLFAVVGFAAAVAGCCTGKCNCPKDSGTTFAHDALQKYVDSGEMPGAISVFYKDGVQETACLGYADIDKRRPITLDDHYMQCSQTKGFCGVTIAQLVEEGKITLDDPVSKYLPEFKDLWVKAGETNGVATLKKAKNTLTVRMCLNHTGGFPFELPNGQAMGGWSRRMPLRSVAAPAAARPVATTRTTVATAIARCTVLAGRTLLLTRRALLPRRTRLLLLLFLRTRLLPAARAAVSMTAALAVSAASAAVSILLRAAVRRALPALGGRRCLAGDLLDQLLEKSKCHSAFLRSVNAKGRGKQNFHGGSLQASPVAHNRAARRRVPN